MRLLDESTGLLVKDTNLAGYAPTPIRSTWSIYAVALLVFVLSVLAMTV